MPNFPDNVVWVYDSKRDRAVMMPGFFFSAGDRALTVCGRDATTDLNIVHGGLRSPSQSRGATMIWGRKAKGVDGYPMYHYRYVKVP